MPNKSAVVPRVMPLSLAASSQPRFSVATSSPAPPAGSLFRASMAARSSALSSACASQPAASAASTDATASDHVDSLNCDAFASNGARSSANTPSETERSRPRSLAGVAGAGAAAAGAGWASDAGCASASASAATSVRAALSVSGGGGVSLTLRVCCASPKAAAAAARSNRQSRQLAALQDYLHKGRADKCANESLASVADQIAEKRRGGTAIQWGCVCAGGVLRGGAELQCRSCALTFHSKCERLDYTPAELARFAADKTFLCSSCQQEELQRAGYDPSAGRFVWQCQSCTRCFEAEEHRTAERHGARCAAELERREWSCVCADPRARKALATECADCGRWFHYGCKAQYRDGGAKDRCVACEDAADDADAAVAVASCSKTCQR
mmetsp:Transcript_24873/g.72777  ORF Transcript_24873/g.72777 Transcript_24873/m.72777 type:complete len:385 (-) Transcript_24873:48-1202(-)